MDGSPSFTPDGRTVVFGSNGDGPYHIYRVSVDGGRPEQLTRGEHSELAVKVSPDGSRAAFARRIPAGAQMRAELGLLDLTSGTERTLGTFGVHNATPHWSPDGKTVLFSDDSSGFQQIILVDAETGAVTPLSPPTHDTAAAGSRRRPFRRLSGESRRQPHPDHPRSDAVASGARSLPSRMVSMRTRN